MTIDNMENADTTEQKIIDRLTYIENENNEKPNENEEAEFDKLHSMLPYLTSKSTTQLDIVLEAITYINMLQNKLIDNLKA